MNEKSSIPPPFYTAASEDLFTTNTPRAVIQDKKSIKRIFYPSLRIHKSDHNPTAPLSANFFGDQPFKNESIQFWKIYFDFGYFLLLNPFRFRWNLEKLDYEVVTSKVQWVFIIIWSTLSGFYYLMSTRSIYMEDDKNNPTKYFELGYYFCDTIFLTVMFYVNSKLRKNQIASVFEILQKGNHIYSHNTVGYKKTRRFAVLLCSLCAGSVFLHFLEIYKDQGWKLGAYFQYYHDDAEKVFSPFLQAPQNSTLDMTFKPVVVPLAVISMLSNLNEKVLNAYSDILFSMTTLMFHSLSKQFVAAMQAETSGPLQILQHYRWLKHTTVKINSSMAIITASFILGNLPFYATNIFDVFKNPNIFIRARYLFYCLYFFPSLVLAAKSNKDIDSVKRWVCQEKAYKDIDPNVLSVVLYEASFETVCISSFRCLNVTYSLVGSIVSVILTYAMLKTQL